MSLCNTLPGTDHTGSCQTLNYQEKQRGTVQSQLNTVAPAPSDRAEPVKPRTTSPLHVSSLLFPIGKQITLKRKCPRNYLYWHDNAYVPHLHTGSLGVKFNSKSLSFTARQVFHSFKFHSKTWNNTLKGCLVFLNCGKM